MIHFSDLQQIKNFLQNEQNIIKETGKKLSKQGKKYLEIRQTHRYSFIVLLQHICSEKFSENSPENFCARNIFIRFSLSARLAIGGIEFFRYIKNSQNQLSAVILRKSYSENMQQIWTGSLMLKCDFNKVALQLYLNHTLA